MMIRCYGCKGNIELEFDPERSVSFLVHTFPWCAEFDAVETEEDAERYYSRCQQFKLEG